MSGARKRFGQHFLVDPNIIQRILGAIQPTRDQHLVEIGPGRGVLTRPLLMAAGRLDAIELDRDLIQPLKSRNQNWGELNVYNADALAFDFSALCDDRGLLRLVGNLPYNISTPLLFRLLEQSGAFQDMHFMLQKEVVDRMAANPHETAYGRLSVTVQYRCQVDPLFVVGARAFTPSPKVESAFVRLKPHVQPPIAVYNEQRFLILVREAFSQRRKTLRNSLRRLLSEADIARAGIDPQARPETLALADFAALSNCRE